MKGCVLVKILQQNLLWERDLLRISILRILISLLYLNEGQRTCFDAIQLEEYRKGKPPTPIQSHLEEIPLPRMPPSYYLQCQTLVTAMQNQVPQKIWSHGV